MPLYEFACDKCGNEFEELVSQDIESILCPACGSKETHKMMSLCCRNSKGGGEIDYSSSSSGGCGSCMGGNCASCGH